MKLFLKNDDEDELIFLPSYLYKEKFENLLKIKDKKYIKKTLNLFFEYLLIDKDKISTGFDISFSNVEKKSIEYFNKKEKIEGRSFHSHDDNLHLKNISINKVELLTLFNEHRMIQKNSEMITFQDIFENNLARKYFLKILDIDFSKKIRNELEKNIEKYVIGNSSFFIDLYKKELRDKNWFNKLKQKKLVFLWLAENIAHFKTHKNETFNTQDFQILSEIFEIYFKLNYENIPIVTFDDFKKKIEEFDLLESRTRKQKKQDLKIIQEKFETSIDLISLEILKISNEINFKAQSEEVEKIFKNCFLNLIRSNFLGETEFVKESLFLFNSEYAIDYIKNEDDLINCEFLIFLNSKIDNHVFLNNLFNLLVEKDQININLLVSIVNSNSSLVKNIINRYWLELLNEVVESYSSSSKSFENVMNTVMDEISKDLIIHQFLSNKNISNKVKISFLNVYKRKKTKQEFMLISEEIIKNLNLEIFDPVSLEYFEILESEVLVKHILNLEDSELKSLTKENGFLENILEIKNKFIIPKLLAAFQKKNIEIFVNFSRLVNSKYFWTAFEYNLRDQESIIKNISLTKTQFFDSFVTKAEGVIWLKSKFGQYWLSLPDSQAWKSSKQGIFTQKIIFDDQSFFIDTEEVFENYVGLIKSISKQNINEAYLINNVPETFNYLIKKDPSIILLIDLEKFDRQSELVKVISKDINKYLKSQNPEIVLRTISFLLFENSYKSAGDISHIIKENLDYFYKHNINWFESNDFIDFMKKNNLFEVFKQLFNKAITGLSENSQKVINNLMQANPHVFLELLIERNSVPFWITVSPNFVQLIKKNSKDAKKMVNIIGEQYFNTTLRNSVLEHRSWFLEFTTIFATQNKKTLRPELINTLNRNCNSQKCKTRKTAKDKEGFIDFYFIFIAIAYSLNTFNQIQRPYRCPYSNLWHKTSDWT